MNTDPSQRPSYRYIKFKIHSESEIKFEELLEAYWDTIPEFVGLKDFSDADAWLIKNKFNQEEQEAVIRVKREYEVDMKAALTLLRNFDGTRGFAEVERVSGAISGVS
ncbi:Rpp14/Pop5 family protein [Candidatus Nanosalina sp. VS9-1]|uniref:Rpp14/Pop5 family protein n=1 Tax=Candidatus Nanosalina sp. VS9-1 TaxID=3388566 RepID=UPI0039E1C82D